MYGKGKYAFATMEPVGVGDGTMALEVMVMLDVSVTSTADVPKIAPSVVLEGLSSLPVHLAPMVQQATRCALSVVHRDPDSQQAPPNSAARVEQEL